MTIAHPAGSSPSQAAKISSLLSTLWLEYTKSNPQAKRIYDLLLSRERARFPEVRELANDHIALRTFNIPKVGLKALAKPFLNLGYVYGGEYFFEQKKLYAHHYQHADPTQPKIFISELELEKLSPFVQETANQIIESIDPQLAASPAILSAGRPWVADYTTYQKLLAESEYAGWMYAFGFRANHFTVSFNALKTFSGLPELNVFLKENGFPLNSSGGEIKGNPQEKLEQSSTLAEKTKVTFTDGVFDIPSCYYEFAKRYANDAGQLYEGFVAASADKIFESTNVATPKR